MGDMKGDFTAKLVLGGKTYEVHWNISWGTHANEDVMRWLDACWDDAMALYRARVAEIMAAEAEVSERAELARLKAKYEAPKS